MNYELKNCTCALAQKMRSAVPMDGGDFSKLIMVDLEKGERVGSHKHAYHTALYYPADAEPIVIKPTAGMIIYLPPGTVHEVPAAKESRVSVAMLVDKDTT